MRGTSGGRRDTDDVRALDALRRWRPMAPSIGARPSRAALDRTVACETWKHPSKSAVRMRIITQQAQRSRHPDPRFPVPGTRPHESARTGRRRCRPDVGLPDACPVGHESVGSRALPGVRYLFHVKQDGADEVPMALPHSIQLGSIQVDPCDGGDCEPPGECFTWNPPPSSTPAENAR